MKSSFYLRAAALLLLVVTLELIALLLLRNVNLDEGWYLWASKLVYEERVLYRDFAYTQTPLLPYVYGAWQQLFGPGLLPGRILTALLSLGTILLSAQVARHWAGPRGAIFCLLLVVTSSYVLAYLSYTATYGLATFLLVAALLVACSSAFHTRANTRNALSLLLLCLAVATRMSVMAALPSLLLYLALTSPRPWRALMWCSGICAVYLGLIFIPFNLISDGLMRYDIFGFHMDRILRVEWQVSKILRILRETILIFVVPLILSAWAIFFTMIRMRMPAHESGLEIASASVRVYPRSASLRMFSCAIAGMILGMAVLHFVPRTTASYYHTLEAPLLWILGGIGLHQMYRSRVQRDNLVKHESSPAHGRVWSPVVPATAFIAFLVIANGVIQTWAVVRNDLVRPSWRPQLAIVDEAAAFLQTIERTDSQLLTFNTHLALESNMEVPPGYEMSIFAYRPTWDVAQARRYKAINNEIYIEDLQQRVDAVAVTEWDLERFYGERDRIFATLEENYRWAKTVPGFDPFHNDLRIYLPPQLQAFKSIATETAGCTDFIFARIRRIFLDAAFCQEGYSLSETGRSVAQVGDGISLVGLDVNQRRFQMGELVAVGLYWHTEATPLRAYTGFVHLLNEAGELVAGWDNPPCHRTCPTTTWQPGEFLRDEYLIDLPPDLAPGSYTVEAGMYESDTGTPLAIIESSLPTIDHRIQLTTIQIE